MTKRPWEPAPPDPGIKPGGIRDRALRAVWARGPVPEDPAKTKASQEYWAKNDAERLDELEQHYLDYERAIEPPTVEDACVDVDLFNPGGN